MGSALPIGEPAPRDGSLPVSIDRSTPFGVYLHVPFCRVRCGYCDFNTYTAGELRGARQDEYADTLLREVDLACGVLVDAGAIRPASTAKGSSLRTTRSASLPGSIVPFCPSSKALQAALIVNISRASWTLTRSSALG